MSNSEFNSQADRSPASPT